METMILTNGSKRFREKFVVSGIVIRSPSFNCKRDAVKWKRAKKNQLKSVSVESIQLKSITLKEFVCKYLEREVKLKNAIRTYHLYKGYVSCHINPKLGERELETISGSDIWEFVDYLQSRGISPKSINDITIFLKQVLGKAKLYGLIQKNPMEGIKPLRIPPKQPDFLSSEEIKSLLQISRGHYSHDAIKFALNTGIRRGEQEGLMWDCVSFERKLVTIRRTRDQFGLRETTKSNRIRQVPMNAAIYELLSKLKEKNLNDRFVFVHEDGYPIGFQHLYRHLKRFLDIAGVKRRVTWHHLRHTFASHYMMNKGSNIYVLQKILGHSNVTMTQKYSHLCPEFLAQTTEGLYDFD